MSYSVLTEKCVYSQLFCPGVGFIILELSIFLSRLKMISSSSSAVKFLYSESSCLWLGKEFLFFIFVTIFEWVFIGKQSCLFNTCKLQGFLTEWLVSAKPFQFVMKFLRIQTARGSLLSSIELSVSIFNSVVRLFNVSCMATVDPSASVLWLCFLLLSRVSFLTMCLYWACFDIVSRIIRLRQGCTRFGALICSS